MADKIQIPDRVVDSRRVKRMDADTPITIACQCRHYWDTTLGDEAYDGFTCFKCGDDKPNMELIA